MGWVISSEYSWIFLSHWQQIVQECNSSATESSSIKFPKPLDWVIDFFPGNPLGFRTPSPGFDSHAIHAGSSSMTRVMTDLPNDVTISTALWPWLLVTKHHGLLYSSAHHDSIVHLCTFRTKPTKNQSNINLWLGRSPVDPKSWEDFWLTNTTFWIDLFYSFLTFNRPGAKMHILPQCHSGIEIKIQNQPQAQILATSGVQVWVNFASLKILKASQMIPQAWDQARLSPIPKTRLSRRQSCQESFWTVSAACKNSKHQDILWSPFTTL